MASPKRNAPVVSGALDGKLGVGPVPHRLCHRVSHFKGAEREYVSLVYNGSGEKKGREC